jgi:hypothetical protein
MTEFYTLGALLSCLQPFEISSCYGTSIGIITVVFVALMMRFKYSSIDSNDRSSYDMVVIVLKMTVLTIGVNLKE